MDCKPPLRQVLPAVPNIGWVSAVGNPRAQSETGLASQEDVSESDDDCLSSSLFLLLAADVCSVFTVASASLEEKVTLQPVSRSITLSASESSEILSPLA
eukprot:CAMPEP_0114606240 /NCGR_PEP_ID=MMETSP0168-20121206/1461_1 /TAXON_ID=95228 ORGANISM="Vannella sp., Strain DIVA3 517/6/12" /NCGR_SAMPLE_ID=MMETSP0168 /ASSEMBLY_ACC=CAM_ASM_000044 /LENGTH=99 /DNA_ID=CAMNT_0001817101 /DNA_START=85 /DNA_END=385 /DNA_ORIENTATION=-